MVLFVENFLNNFKAVYFIGIIVMYLLLPFGLAISEEILTIIVGILVVKHFVSPFSGFLGAFLGVYLSDLICYGLGVLAKRSVHGLFLKKLYRTKDKISIYDQVYQKFKVFSIFIVKFLIGIKFWIYVGAGYKKFNFKIFALEDIFAALIFSVIYLSIGYFFGMHLNHIIKLIVDFKYIIIGVAAIVIVLFIIFRRKKNEKETPHIP